MTRQPGTRDELLDALTIERFGPLTPEYRNHHVPVIESTTDQVIRRYELALAVDDIPAATADTDPRPEGAVIPNPDLGGAARA